MKAEGQPFNIGWMVQDILKLLLHLIHFGTLGGQTGHRDVVGLLSRLLAKLAEVDGSWSPSTLRRPTCDTNAEENVRS